MPFFTAKNKCNKIYNRQVCRLSFKALINSVPGQS